MLRLNPGFALVAIVSLALGTGANTAIFQLLDSIRLRSLPVKAPQELVELRIEDMSDARGNWLRQNALTNPLWERIRDAQQEFSGMFAWASEPFNLAQNGESRQIGGLWVSGDFFRVLGVDAIRGRVFTASDDRRGCGLAPGAVISYGFWQREFGGDASVVGRRVQIGDQSIEVIGVARPGFYGLEVGRTFDIALPICSEPAWHRDGGRLDSGTTWWLTVMGRLKPGVTMEQADARFQARSAGIFEVSVPSDYPRASVKTYREMKLIAIPAGSGLSRLRKQYAAPLAMLLAIAGFVLLIACANLANLMLARASAREREIAVRLAVGASRARLVQLLLTEGMLLAGAGTLLGLVLAQVLSRFLISFLTTGADSAFLDLSGDWRVFAFTAALAVLTCLLFSLTPALRAVRTNPADALKSGGRTIAGERSGLRRILVVSQIALSLVLVVGALLFSGTLRKLTAVDAGFQQHGMLVADVGFKQGNPVEIRREIIERLRSIPGAESVAEGTLLPLTNSNWNSRIWMDGSDSAHAHVAWRSMIGTDYFRTFQTPLIAGREFDDHDVRSLKKVAIVNEVFAREFGGGVGKRFWVEATPYEPETAFEIVGVVKNTKYLSLREDFQPLMYIPLQKAVLEGQRGRFVIRSRLDAGALSSAVKRALAEVNPEMRYSLHFLDSWIEETLLRERLMATLSALFGALAMALTAVGIYGVISYMVARRTNEIGIRIALGARRRGVIALILGEAVVVLAAGLGIGALLAITVGRGAKALLFGLESYDPLAFMAAASLLTAVVVAASLVPAWRAASVNPVIALRQD